MRLLILILFLPASALADVTVFAAASLRTALDELTGIYHDQTGTRVSVSYAGSPMLARQISQGAPADLFISANEDWVGWLQDQGFVRDRVDLLGNTLVVIGSGPGPDTDGALPDSELFEGVKRLAMAQSDSVPAGIYGKAALSALGLWHDLEPRLVQTDNVRAALALVALGEAPLGVVYATDAMADPNVHVLASFPPKTHPPIRYPAALIDRHDPHAPAFLTWLSGTQAWQVFDRHGFSAPPAP